MPSFGRKSLAHLGTCHVDAQVIMAMVIKEFDCTILEGHRSHELQEQFFRDKLTTKRGGQSLHNRRPSMAWHAMPWFATKPHVDWKHRESMQHLAGYIRGTAAHLLQVGLISHAVRWGGDWDRDFDVREEQWDDFAHYELRQP